MSHKNFAYLRDGKKQEGMLGIYPAYPRFIT